MPSETVQLKIPPQVLEAERAILGGMLLNNDALPRVMATLAADDFYKDAHRQIYAAMVELAQKNEPVDWITLTAALKNKGSLETVGGIPFLTELGGRHPHHRQY